jgi:hypothetical protein
MLADAAASEIDGMTRDFTIVLSNISPPDRDCKI